MSSAVFGFAADFGPAERLARELGVAHRVVAVRHFPDGESLVRVEPSPPTALLYRSLDYPNAKLVELLLTVAALRDNGATRVVLVAPYLGYMRQDTAFHPGEAVSQRVIGKLLADHFDALLTLDPHLHRTHSLEEIMPGIEAVSVSAAPLLAAALDKGSEPLLIGPDREARQWVERIAQRLQAEFVLASKRRIGDREVDLVIPDLERAAGRAVILVDDLVSSGATLRAAARMLQRAGAISIDVLATHCLAGEDELADMRTAGIATIRATDSVAGPAAVLPTAALLANEIRNRRWCQ